ncbi:MAG: hypothetical protein HKP58_20205 [Desulfatitalea sp.]|nr:hypothetical protein [Desulfatitalea sp.]NNK02741.1 hypothetical protein [Desulfatitalea sp.]
MHGNQEIEWFTGHTPPEMERVFGYRGTERWVAFFWGKRIVTASNCYGFDGSVFNPVHHFAWDAFFSHALIRAVTHGGRNGLGARRFEFGDDRRPSEHWLMLDRGARILFSARKQIALNHLKNANTRIATDPSDFGKSCGAHRVVPHPAAQHGTLHKINEMVHWLDLRWETVSQARIGASGPWESATVH